MKKTNLRCLAVSMAALLMAAFVGGCGSSQTAATTAAPAAAETQAAAPAQTAAAAKAELTISFSATYQQAETGGQIISYFIDRVKELSGGKIDVKASWGGTLFDSPSELDGVSSGAVDMIALNHMGHPESLVYLSFPGFAPGGTQAALDYFNTIMFDDPTTSALVTEEANGLGIKYLNVIAGGGNALCSKQEFKDLADLVAKSSAFGNFDAAIWEALGFQVSALFPPDIYDALNRGQIDASEMALAPMVSLGWYEVAPYWALDGTYAAGNFFTVNLDWWNGLSDEFRGYIQQAADETEAYSATIYDASIDQDIATVETSTGHKFVELSQGDIDTIWAACFEAKADAALVTGANSGKTEGLTVILEKAAELTGYDWKH
ncbi:MAG: TRAP transporter substrate-binding protein DctP [Lachnospiraceae bacterium]|jgi:TRAP-type C4-dicarboxylate transport system substrate-binding protein|nr:TRAP transporter substrate-binding protein DctP [Lachnospiraceae bacterium]